MQHVQTMAQYLPRLEDQYFLRLQAAMAGQYQAQSEDRAGFDSDMTDEDRDLLSRGSSALNRFV
jgi:hypothetical protein